MKSSLQNNFFRKITNNILIVIFIVSIIFYSFAKIEVLIPNYFSIFFGLIILIFIPGYYLASIIPKKISIDVFLFSFVFGLTFQTINISLYSIFSSVIKIDFSTLLLFGSIVVIIVSKVIAYKMDVSYIFGQFKIDVVRSLRNPAFYIFFFALIVRLYYSSYNNSSLFPDAALYLDNARTLVSKNTFSFNVLFDESLGSLTTLGLIEHEFIVYIFSIFFLIYNTSINAALLALVLIGSFMVYPVYYITNEFFGKKAALLAAIIFSLHPLFIYFSSILFGPEISGLFFLLVSFYLIIEGSKNKNLPTLIIAGILLGVSNELWWPQFYIAIPFASLLLVLFYNNSLNYRDINFLKNLLPCEFFVILYVFALKLYSLYFIYLPIIFIETIAILWSSKSPKKQIFFTLNFVAGLIIPTMISVIRHYIFPSQISSIIADTAKEGIIPSIINAFTLFLHISSFISFIDYTKYLYYYATAIILILFFMALLISGKKKGKYFLGSLIIFDCVLVSLMPPPSYPEYLTSQGRYYLLPILLMIIVGSSFLLNIIEITLNKIKLKSINTGRKFKTISLPSITVLIVLIILFNLFFIPQYQQYIQDINQENPITKYGWSNNMLNWIRSNTSDQDVLLTSRARELSWFTDRRTVSIMSPTTSPEDIGYTDLIQLYQQFKVKYLVVENYFDWSFPKLSDFYQSANISIGTVILPSDLLISQLTQRHSTNNTIKAYSFELVKYENLSNGGFSIWKLNSPRDFVFNYSHLDLSSKDWGIGNGGDLLVEGNASKLVIGSGKTYDFFYLKNPLNINLNKQTVRFIAWDINETNNANVTSIELWKNGNHLLDLHPPSKIGPSVTLFDVSSFDNIRIVINGKSNGNISINWFVIGNYYIN